MLVLENDSTVGFILGARRLREPAEMVEVQKELAWIKLFAVREGFRKRGIATMLFNEFEDRVKEDGAKVIRIADYPIWTLSSGVDLKYEDAIDFMQGRGFRKTGEVGLTEFHIPKRIKKIDTSPVIVRRAEDNDRRMVLEWVKSQFSIFWAWEAYAAFKHDKPKPWITEDDGKIVGFSVYSALEPHLFCPIGVSPHMRFKGISSVLLFNCLDSMREDGQSYAVIPWTNHLFFYTQVPGITGIRHYWIMEKAIS
ncbi:MAG: GNAT family N-acetyltransferase [Candidatus Brockarchaeota archaeon]|nr:GNAT family N-acetyltransferase [Candidatus Brockarchaeota archaeon]